MRRICLVGAGNISQTHAEVLRGLSGVQMSAVVDPNENAALSFARQWNIPKTFSSVEAALAENAFDCAHVLVPPNIHRGAALPILAAGKPVLLEKPLAVSSSECAELLGASGASAVLGVNQNFVFHPAFLRLRQALQRRSLGAPRYIDCLYNMPLRQLAAGQFGHWMFDAPNNLLLEQAVHPLSQIVRLAGPVEELRVASGAPMEIAAGKALYPTLSVLLRCRDLSATLRFAVGQSFPAWQIMAVCDDGTVTADMIANSVSTSARTRWMEAVDGFVTGHRKVLENLRDAWGNTLGYALATARLTERRDAFYQSMKGGISAFHAALDASVAPEIDGTFGAGLVHICEAIGGELPAASPPAIALPAIGNGQEAPKIDVAILGGTGFIGSHVTRRLVGAGLNVAVMARNLRNLPAAFHADGVVLRRGDIRSAADVANAIDGARIVVNLAHGGGGKSFEEIRAAMVGGTETIAKACLAKGVSRFIHVGSIASLYLGPQDDPITGRTPADGQPDLRADYARAKILCDRLLLDLYVCEKLPVTILRPGIVVGEGSSPFHSGLGFFNNEQHCIGWNAGRNPLPFVLAEDVAEAVLLATRAADIEGRCYNLVGDVRLTAREYIDLLGHALERPLHFHPKHPTELWGEEMGKWAIKRIVGRAVPPPARHDILSRGMTASFDTGDVKNDLGWQPSADRTDFIRRAIDIHASPPR